MGVRNNSMGFPTGKFNSCNYDLEYMSLTLFNNSVKDFSL